MLNPCQVFQQLVHISLNGLNNLSAGTIQMDTLFCTVPNHFENLVEFNLSIVCIALDREISFSKACGIIVERFSVNVITDADYEWNDYLGSPDM